MTFLTNNADLSLMEAFYGENDDRRLALAGDRDSTSDVLQADVNAGPVNGPISLDQNNMYQNMLDELLHGIPYIALLGMAHDLYVMRSCFDRSSSEMEADKNLLLPEGSTTVIYNHPDPKNRQTMEPLPVSVTALAKPTLKIADESLLGIHLTTVPLIKYMLFGYLAYLKGYQSSLEIFKAMHYSKFFHLLCSQDGHAYLKPNKVAFTENFLMKNRGEVSDGSPLHMNILEGYRILKARTDTQVAESEMMDFVSVLKFGELSTDAVKLKGGARKKGGPQKVSARKKRQS